MDFDRLNTLEYLAVADEVFYSAILRWLFGPDSALSLKARLRVLEMLTGDSFADCAEIHATTEWKNVDLVLDLRSSVGIRTIAIENKVKSVESETQLARYDARLASATKLFLTLTGERPRAADSDWKPISYAQVLEALRQVGADVSNQYFRDYVSMLERLLEASRLVVSGRPEFAAFVFAKGRARNASIPTGFASYVTRLRLEKILQRAWLQAVGTRALASLASPLGSHWKVSVESEKQALLNVQSQVYAVGVLGLQLQHGKFKFFTRPHAYLKSTPESTELERLHDVLLKLRRRLAPCSNPTAHKGKGFRSLVSTESVPRTEINSASAVLTSHIERLLSAVDSLEHAGILIRRGKDSDHRSRNTDAAS